MIQTTIEEAWRYYSVNPRFEKLFKFIKNHNLLEIPYGRIDIDNDKIFINNFESTLTAHEIQKLEVHPRYIDIHIPLNGSGIIGWAPLSSLGKSEKPFDKKKDIAFYNRLAQVYTNVIPGQCLIVFPEDAHAPVIGYGKLKKAVGKVLIE